MVGRLHMKNNLCGIYSLWWENSESYYIGQSIDIHTRFNQHLFYMRRGAHPNYKIQQCYNQHGEPKLVVLGPSSKDQLLEQEEFWCAEFDTKNNLNIIVPGTVSGYGDKAPMSKYSRAQILKTFSMLYRGLHIQKDIASKARVSIGFVQNMKVGHTHTWLADIYPEQYRIMRSMCKSRKRVN